MKQVIKETTFYVTSDGKEFTHESAAESHEKSLENRKEADRIKAKLKLLEVHNIFAFTDC